MPFIENGDWDVAKPFIGVYHAQWWSVPQHSDFMYAFSFV